MSLKCVWNLERPQIVILRKMSKNGNISLPDLKLFYEVLVIKIHMYYWNADQ